MRSNATASFDALLSVLCDLVSARIPATDPDTSATAAATVAVLNRTYTLESTQDTSVLLSQFKAKRE